MRNPVLPLLTLALLLPAGAFATTYNVRDFGATGDGTTKDTRAFQKALDACAVNGGGDVLAPAGKYLIGSIQIGNRTILRLEKDTILAGSPDINDYPLIDIRWEGRWQPGHRGLIYATAVDHIGIIGPGRIEGSTGPAPAPAAAPVAGAAAPTTPPGRGGRGRTGWGTNGPDGTRNPVVLEPISCNDVRWDGFTVTQGGNWATHPTYCDNVEITNLNISGGRDGIDVDSCRNVRIDHCVIANGDDCVSLKSGRGMDGARLGRPCEDILITNCTMTGGNFACVGIGSETSGGVRNVRIEHCKMSANTHVIYIKTRIGRAGINENISADDIDVLAGDFLRINLVKGGNNSTADDPVEGLIGYPEARNLSFSNIRMMGPKAVPAGEPAPRMNGAKALIVGTEVSALKPVRGLTVTNVSGQHTGITLANMSEVVLKNVVAGVAPAKPAAPSANGQPAPGPVFGIVNVTGSGLEGAVAIPAPIDPPVGNAAGNAPGNVRGGRGGANAPAPAAATTSPAASTGK
jgi:polygalacturonase